MVNLFTIRVVGTTMTVVASMILATHVLVLHAKFDQPTDTKDAVVRLNEREEIERAFIIGSVLLYLVGYVLILAAAILERRQNKT